MFKLHIERALEATSQGLAWDDDVIAYGDWTGEVKIV